MRTTITYTILIILIAVGFAGCDWFSSGPNDGVPKLYWKTKIHTTGGVDGRFPNVIFNNKIFITMAQVAEYETKIVGLDIETGQQLWEWKDYFNPGIESSDFSKVAQFGNNIVFAEGGRHYCINAETGKTAWRNRVDNASTSAIVQLGNKYFYAGPFYNNLGQHGVFMGIIETGENIEVYHPEPGTSMKAPAVFLSDEGDIMLAIVESRIVDEANYLYSQTYVLYNVTKKVKIYSITPSTPTSGTSGYKENIIWDNKLYSDIGKGLICLNLKTGEKIWEKSTNGDFLFSNFIVHDGFLYANCENGYRYKLDANTGFVKWQELNTGTCSPIFMMNNVLYYIGGGDGKLYAVDPATGSVIWKVTNPDDRGNGFMPSTPNGFNGRIYCSGFYYAYCYEAAK